MGPPRRAAARTFLGGAKSPGRPPFLTLETIMQKRQKDNLEKLAAMLDKRNKVRILLGRLHRRVRALTDAEMIGAPKLTPALTHVHAGLLHLANALDKYVPPPKTDD